MSGRIAALLSMLAILLLFAACGGPVTEEDLQRWTNNDKGLERVTEIVADPKHPVETRIRALEVVVEKRFVTRLRIMLDGIKDEREAIMNGLSAELREHLLNPEDPLHMDAKDALLLLLRYVKPDEVDGIQKAIAKWAFGDISWELSVAEIEEKISSRISAGQIKDLGSHAYQAAAILIANTIEVDEMLDLLSRAENKEYAAKLTVRGLEKLHSVLSVQHHHIKALRKLPSRTAALYLLKLYQTGEEAFIQALAYNAMLEMTCPKVCLSDKEAAKDSESCATCCAAAQTSNSFYNERLRKCQCDWDGKSAEYTPCRPHDAIEKSHDEISEALLEAMKTTDSMEDLVRWTLARLRMLGPESLTDSLSCFREDHEAFGKEFDNEAANFCNYVRDDNFSRGTIPIFEKQLESKNRVIQAVSVICLKINRSQRSRAKLLSLARQHLGTGNVADIQDGSYAKKIAKALKKAKEDEIVLAKDDISLVGFMSEDSYKSPMSVGKLALNAVMGLDLFKKTEGDHRAKEFDADEFGRRMNLIAEEHTFLGEAYGAMVDEKIQAWRAAMAEAAKKEAEAEEAAAAAKKKEEAAAKEKEANPPN